MSTLIAQFNLQHSAVCNYDLNTFIRESQTTGLPVVAAMQEPHRGPKSLTGFPDSCTIWDRTCSGADWPRAALYVSAGVNIVPFPDFISRDMVAGFWTTGVPAIGEVVIASVYIEGGNDAPKEIPNSIKSLISFCTNGPLWGPQCPHPHVGGN